MIMREVSREEFNSFNVRRGTTKIKSILDEFIKMEAECIELDWSNYASPTSLQGTLKGSIKRFHYNSLDSFTRNGKVYLFKKSIKGGKDE